MPRTTRISRQPPNANISTKQGNNWEAGQTERNTNWAAKVTHRSALPLPPFDSYAHMPPAPLPPPAPSYSPTPPLCIVCSFPFLYETVINGQGGGLMCGDCEGAVRFVGDEKWRRDNQELPMSGAPLSGAHTPPLETALQVGLQTGLFKTSLQASLNSSLQPSILSPLPPDLVALLPPSLPPSVPPSVPPSIPFPPTSTLAPALAPALNSTLTASDVLFCLTQTERNYLLKRVRKLEWTSPAKLYELTVRVYDISRRYDEERNKKKEAKERIPSQLPHAMEQSRQALPELPAPVQTPAPNPTLDPLQVLLTGAELTDELDKVQPECDNPNNSSPEESELVVVNGREFPTYVGAAKASAAAPVTKEAMAEEQETKNEGEEARDVGERSAKEKREREARANLRSIVESKLSAPKETRRYIQHAGPLFTHVCGVCGTLCSLTTVCGLRPSTFLSARPHHSFLQHAHQNSSNRARSRRRKVLHVPRPRGPALRVRGVERDENHRARERHAPDRARYGVEEGETESCRRDGCGGGEGGGAGGCHGRGQWQLHGLRGVQRRP